MIQEHNRKARGITKLILMVPPGGIHYYIQKKPQNQPTENGLVRLGEAPQQSKVAWPASRAEKFRSPSPPRRYTLTNFSKERNLFWRKALSFSRFPAAQHTFPAYQWPNKKFRHTLLWTLDWNCYMKFIYAKQRVLAVSPALFLKTSRELSCKEGFYLRE